MSRGWAVALGGVAVVAVLLASVVVYVIVRYRLYNAPSDSMAPTIRAHQTFVVDRFAYRDHPPSRNDIVTFAPPLARERDYVKRIVAVPGDRLVIHAGRMMVNGRPVRDKFAVKDDYELAVRDYGLWYDGQRLDPSLAVIPPRRDWTAADAVPPGCYVVLGDNRTNSFDSHAFGFLCPGQPVPGQPDVHPELRGRMVAGATVSVQGE